MVADRTIRELEERAMNAVPALESEHYDGWILRAAGGYTGRANSATPLDDGRVPVADKLAHTEAWYRTRNLPPMIRLTPGSRPSGLDSVLEERGYVLRDEGVSVQTRSLPGNGIPTSPVEVLSDGVPSHWLDALAGFQSRVAKHLSTVSELFDRLPHSSAWATIRRDRMPAAIGRAVLEGADIGLFDVITHPDFRRTGLATEVTLALLSWGIEHGADRAYLQVVPSNEAAIRLYAKLGFEEAYGYWYRVAAPTQQRKWPLATDN